MGAVLVSQTVGANIKTFFKLLTVTVHFHRMKLVCLLMAVLVSAAPASANIGDGLVAAGKQLAEKFVALGVGFAADVVFNRPREMLADWGRTMGQIAEPVMDIGEHVLEIGGAVMGIVESVEKAAGPVHDLLNLIAA